jgi:hypothetical protein
MLRVHASGNTGLGLDHARLAATGAIPDAGVVCPGCCLSGQRIAPSEAREANEVCVRRMKLRLVFD